MQKAIWYKGDEIIEVEPENKETFTLEELQAFVEGTGPEGTSKTIQYLPLPDGRVMFVNDNGRIIGLPYNENASKFWREQYPIEKYPHNNEGIIVGNAIVCTSKQAGEEEEEEGE